MNTYWRLVWPIRGLNLYKAGNILHFSTFVNYVNNQTLKRRVVLTAYQASKTSFTEVSTLVTQSLGSSLRHLNSRSVLNFTNDETGKVR